MKKKVTTIYEKYFKVYYPAEGYAHGFSPTDEEVLLDVPCDTVERAKALKMKAIAEEEGRQTRMRARGDCPRWIGSIKAELYWKAMDTVEEVIN